MDPLVHDIETLLTDARYAYRQLMMRTDPDPCRAADALERMVERLERMLKEETAPYADAAPGDVPW